jgi:hypothetical protein
MIVHAGHLDAGGNVADAAGEVEILVALDVAVMIAHEEVMMITDMYLFGSIFRPRPEVSGRMSRTPAETEQASKLMMENLDSEPGSGKSVRNGLERWRIELPHTDQTETAGSFALPASVDGVIELQLRERPPPPWPACPCAPASMHRWRRERARAPVA